MQRKATVRQLNKLGQLGLIYADGGGSPMVPVPFLGGCGNPTIPINQVDPKTKTPSRFAGYLYIPRQGDEVLVSRMGTRAVASYSMTLSDDGRFPLNESGESGQFDGDGKRQGMVFHADGSTTLFNAHGQSSITVSADGGTLTITAPGGLNIVGAVHITGSLWINGTQVVAP